MSDSLLEYALQGAYPKLVVAIKKAHADGIDKGVLALAISLANPALLSSVLGDAIGYYIEEVYGENQSGNRLPEAPRT
jgi:hypothetical protein